MNNGSAAGQPKKRAPPPPPRKDSEMRLSTASGHGDSPTRVVQADASGYATRKVELPKFLGVQLIELVRVGTKASHSTCVDVAVHFLAMLRDELPNADLVQLLREVETQINQSESTSQTWCITDVHSLIERSDDATRFRRIMLSLARQCRSEQQHRSTYFDDDDELLSALAELKTVCTDADRRIVQYCISDDDYSALQTLSTLFCVDSRAQVRTSLIDTLLRVVRTDRKCVTILLESAFAFELARQFAELAIDTHVRGDRVSRLTDLVVCRANSTLTRRLVCMLTALFATGEQLPVALSDPLNVDFIANCLRRLETASNGEDDSPNDTALSIPDCESSDTRHNQLDDAKHDLSELLFTMLVSFNLHFTDIHTNVLVAAMRGAAADTRTFTEKLLCHFNALDDPVERYRPASAFRPFRIDATADSQMETIHEKLAYPNCVTKALADCYADAVCAELFYTNDAKALVDILLRFVADMNAGDAVRTDVLTLTQLVVRSGTFAEHRHRIAELRESVSLAAAADVIDTDSEAEAVELRERVLRDRAIACRIVEEIDHLG